MRVLLNTLAGLLLAAPSYGQVNPNYHWVDAYTTQDGTYVPGHYSTDPNYTNRDNYSTYPNVNPWTGEQGTVQPDQNYQPAPLVPGQVRESRASGGDYIGVATSPVPIYNTAPTNYQWQPRFTPAERAARRAKAARDRAAHWELVRKRDMERKEAKRKEKAAKRAAREVSKEDAQ